MRVFRIEGKVHTREWSCWIENGNEVHTQSGIADGKMNHTFDVVPSVGKPGTKAFIPPNQNAVLEAARKIRKKVEAGYVEVDPDTKEPMIEAANELDFTRLPKNLCFMKCRKPPENTKQQKEFDRIVENGIITIKRDGFMHPILIDAAGKVRIYTRRMDECTDKYPHLVESLRGAKLPKKTILLCEFVVERANGSDDRIAIQAISNSKADKARAKQQAGPKARAVILLIPFWDGVSMADQSFGMAIEFLEQQFGTRDRCPPYFEPMEVFYGDFEEAKQRVYSENLEGLVIYDANASPGDKLFNFRGKPERPMAFKWKPIYEDDFVAMWDPDGKADGRFIQMKKGERGEWGRGRRKGQPKNLALYQMNSDGDWVFIAHVGTGLKDEQLKEIMDRVDDLTGFVGVAEIEYTFRRYESRGDGSNALVEPRFTRWRDDKTETECVDDEL